LRVQRRRLGGEAWMHGCAMTVRDPAGDESELGFGLVGRSAVEFLPL
jgi:hypothetical protein